MVVNDIRRHKIMEEALRSIMGSGLPPSFKFKDTYESIVFPQDYTVPSQVTVEAKFNELLALEDDNPKTSILGDLEVGTANLYVNVSESSVGIGTSTPQATLQVVGNVHVSSNLEVSDTFFVDTDTGYVGIGTTTPDDQLQVTGNTYISSNLQVDDTLFVDTTTGRVGIGTTIPTTNLQVTGNTYISSNLQVSDTFFVDTTTNRVGIGTTTPEANLHVEGTAYISNGGRISGNALRIITGANRVGFGGVVGTPYGPCEVLGNVYVSSDLQVGSNFTLDKTTGNVGMGVTNPGAELTVEGRIHTKKGRYVFDLENTRPEYYPRRNNDDRHICMVGGNFDLVSLPGTNVRKYVPSTNTDTSHTTNSNLYPERQTSVAAIAGEEWYQEGGSLFISPRINEIHKMVPFSAAGRIFGFYNNRYKPADVYFYAPYEDVTVNIYVNRSINSEDPTFTLNLTKQTVTTQSSVITDNNSTCVIEAIGGVILCSKASNGGDYQVIYPASDLSYNYYNQNNTLTFGHSSDIFSNSYNYSSLSIIRSGAAFHCPNGACPTVTYVGDGDGGNLVFPIPYEMLATTYYVAHPLVGYVLIATSDDPIEVTTYTNDNGSTNISPYNIVPSDKGGIDPYNPREFRSGNVGNVGTNLSISGQSFWKFTSNKPFGLRVEAGNEDEYWAWGKTTSQTPVYRLTYSLRPLIYKVNLIDGVNVNAGSFDTAYEATVFDTDNPDGNEIAELYGSGFVLGTNYITVPSAGLYKIHFNIGFYRTDINSNRTSVGVGFVANSGSTTTLIGKIASTGYIRNDSGHTRASCSGTLLTSIGGGFFESGSSSSNYDDFKIKIFFYRRTDITEAVYTNGTTSFVMIEKIT